MMIESEAVNRVRKARDVELANVRIVVKRKYKRKLEQIMDEVKANYADELSKIRDEADVVKLRLMQKELENDRMLRHLVQSEGLMEQWQHEYPATNFRVSGKNKIPDMTSSMSKNLSLLQEDAEKNLRVIRSQEEMLLIS